MVEAEGYRIASLLGDARERADRLLAALFDLPRARIQRDIERQNILLNGSPIPKNSFSRFHARDTIEAEIEPLEELSLAPESIPLDIVHENDDFLIIDKPPRMVVHPAPGHPSGTLMNGIMHHLGAHTDGDIRPGLVHRIDKDTSGLLVIARSATAFTELAARFAAHDIERSYLALAWGHPAEERGTIRTRHARDPRNRLRFHPATIGGRTAITHYEVVDAYRSASLLRLHLETGRTHQIRMHLKHIGHPVVNDELYDGLRPSGDRRIEQALAQHRRQMLHAAELGFTCGGRTWHFTSPIPPDMREIIAAFEAAR